MVGVNHTAPQVRTPDAWTVNLHSDLSRDSSSIETWWDGFHDPVLNELIGRTRHGNPDLRVAAQRIPEMRALRGVAQSRLNPDVSTTRGYSRNRSSENLFGAPPKNPSNLYSTGLDTRWELDFFGGLRRELEAADANVGASFEAYRDTLVTLLAETAMSYVEYRTLQERIRVANENVKAQKESVDLAQSRLDDGLAPSTDVAQATVNWRSTRAEIPQLRGQLAQARNRIATLTGGYPASVEGLLRKQRSIPVPPRSFGTGVPADLIRSRPDIRQAERNLAAQTAQIGVAEADLYPRFSLFGQFSLQSLEASDLVDSASGVYSFGPSIQWQIFSAGRIRSNIRAAEARSEQALVNYEKTVLLAVEEVETSMAAVANERDRQSELRRAVTASREAVELVKGTYEDGLIDFQRVLEAERARFNNEDSAVVSRGQIAWHYIRLYKALGGGSKVELVPIPRPRIQGRGGPFHRRQATQQEEGDGGGQSTAPALPKLTDQQNE